VDAKILVERLKVRVVPQDAVTVLGSQTYASFWKTAKPSRLRWTRDQRWNLDRNRKNKNRDAWHAVTGSEEFIVGNLSELVDGQTVVAAHGE